MTVHEHQFEGWRFVYGTRSTCTCGWEGGIHGGEQSAVDEWDEHCDQVFITASARTAEKAGF